MRSLNTLRQSIHNQEGSVKSNVAVAIGAIAVTGVVAAFFFNKSPASVTPKTYLNIEAQTVVDKLSLPASMQIVEIEGSSSTVASLDIDMSVGIGPFNKDISVGSISFPSKREGEVVIKFDTLKNPDNNATVPKVDNSDKNIKLIVEEDGGEQHLVIEADPDAFDAVTQNMQSDTIATTVNTSGAISFFRSLGPEQTEQIATGSIAYNDENFRRECSEKFTEEGIVRAGLAKAVAVQLQTSAPVIFQVLSKEFPDNPEVIQQAVDHIANLADPSTIEVRIVDEPNSDNPTPSSELDFGYMQEGSLTGDDMAQYIGLNSEYIEDITVDNKNNTCDFTSKESENDLTEIKSKWLAATPYNEAQIARNAE